MYAMSCHIHGTVNTGTFVYIMYHVEHNIGNISWHVLTTSSTMCIMSTYMSMSCTWSLHHVHDHECVGAMSHTGQVKKLNSSRLFGNGGGGGNDGEGYKHMHDDTYHVHDGRDYSMSCIYCPSRPPIVTS